VHNSGHWTIEGALSSQFENHIRAISASARARPSWWCRASAMKNLIGEDVASWREIMADTTAHVHLYGKGEARPGRKMGHVTWLEY
jgi:5-(carboxyamino)imidazole ribonucleotide synthase